MAQKQKPLETNEHTKLLYLNELAFKYLNATTACLSLLAKNPEMGPDSPEFAAAVKKRDDTWTTFKKELVRNFGVILDNVSSDGGYTVANKEYRDKVKKAFEGRTWWLKAEPNDHSLSGLANFYIRSTDKGCEYQINVRLNGYENQPLIIQAEEVGPKKIGLDDVPQKSMGPM